MLVNICCLGVEECRYPIELDSDYVAVDWVRACALVARYLVLHPPDLECTPELHRAFRQIRLTLEQDAWNYATPLQKEKEKEAHISMLNVRLE